MVNLRPKPQTSICECFHVPSILEMDIYKAFEYPDFLSKRHYIVQDITVIQTQSPSLLQFSSQQAYSSTVILAFKNLLKSRTVREVVRCIHPWLSALNRWQATTNCSTNTYVSTHLPASKLSNSDTTNKLQLLLIIVISFQYGC